MKTLVRIIVLIVLLITLACVQSASPQVYNPNGPVSDQLFYDQLSPYGMWVNYPPYGYVWIPDVGGGFTPYATSGNWVYSNYGWTWYSYYRWGWAPFHYGRWFYDNVYGWAWIPDTVWGPAWVVWSTGGGYYGWAPLGPNVNVSLVIQGRQTIPREQWVFVREKELPNRNIGRYRIEQSRNRDILNGAMLVRETRELDRHVSYTPGPSRVALQKATGKEIQSVGVREKSKPGNGRLTNRELEIYKPVVERRNDVRKRSSPERSYELKDVPTSSERYRPRSRNSNANEYWEKSTPRSNHVKGSGQQLIRTEQLKGIEQRGNSGRPRKKGA